MTTTISSPTLSPPPPRPALRVREPFLSRFSNRARFILILFALMLPTLGAKALFTYYPQFSAVKYSFYFWDGQQTEEFRWFANYKELFFEDKLFWPCFNLTIILFVANLFKMWPSIFTAIALHRIRSEKAQYLYRVLFVIPMIIPGLIGLLLWKNLLFESQNGVINHLLNFTGLIHVLRYLDTAWPALAQQAIPVRQGLLDTTFGSVWAIFFLAIAFFTATSNFKSLSHRVVTSLILAVVAALIWLIPQQLIHFLIWLPLALGFPLLVQKLYRRDVSDALLRYLGWGLLLLGALTVATTMFWTKQTFAFTTDRPTWLGHTALIVPTLILWGFPWVGTVGVLIYLAGLQSISTDVYEAAELDGVSSFGRIFHIELPLILAQVRINLVFMTIGTLTDYGLVLLLLGPEGGTGNAGMVPGLYSYRESFINGRFGYACAIGMVMFVIIMLITMFYQKYVKVDK